MLIYPTTYSQSLHFHKAYTQYINLLYNTTNTILLGFISIAAGKKHLICYFTQFQISFQKQNSKKFTSHAIGI